jgi:hypothetical protein
VSARFLAGDTLPAVLVLRDMGDIFGWGTSRTYDLYKQGEFARFELLPRMGNRPRFSGKKVQAWLELEDGAVETQSRYFKNSRRAAALRGVK